MSREPKTIITTAKTVDEAISVALKSLELTREQVEINVLEEGSKGVFGLGGKNAKVEVTEILRDLTELAAEYMKTIVTLMGHECDVDAKREQDTIYINIVILTGGNIIGRHGETLDALQYLANLYINKHRDGEDFIRAFLDSEGYRAKREKTLVTLATSVATKVSKFRKEIALEPMSSYERRIIHSALQNFKNITTRSVGEEPYRKIVIQYKRS